ncbi:small multi-drug export protein [Bacillus manliponensis]|uniref:small multi-drug export protein n=1 Tax=Bacillus manliponensis TaxID=574376 RepID=UPI0035112B56
MLQEIIQKISDINIFYQFLMIFIIGLIPFFEAHVAVPVGAFLNLPFIPVAALGIIANFLSVMLIILFANFLRSSFLKNRDKDSFFNKRFHKANSYFNKYGVPGLSLMGPILGANHISAFVSIVAGASKKQVITWQIISIILWGVGTGLLVLYGVDILSI